MVENTGTAAATDEKRKARRSVVGVVVKARKTPKTLRVESVFQVRHVHYGKFVRRKTVMHVHDPKDEANVGDRVLVMECRPVSKQKNFRLVKILERAPQD